MDDNEIGIVIRSWEQAIQQGDVEGILANHTRDILMFDVPEPIQARGIEAYRKTWKLFFEYGKPAADVFVVDDLEITAGDEVAFATGLLRIGGSQEPVCRLTLGLKKVDGRWLIAHEHHSAPHKLGRQ
jgi:ketosteroid isomerase-like protein